MFSVDDRIGVSRNRRSQPSTASQRSSTGVRFQRWHFVQTTQSRPLAASKARRRPTGKLSSTSFEPRGFLQNMQVVYIAIGPAQVKKLSAAFVKTVKRPGRYGDGRGGFGLSLLVKPTTTGRLSKTWSQRLRIHGHPVNIGLGAYPVVTLAEARETAYLM